MGTDTRQGILLNVVVGVVGAAVGGWLLSPFLGVSTINQGNFTMPGLGVAFLGALVLLAVVNLVRRGSPLAMTITPPTTDSVSAHAKRQRMGGGASLERADRVGRPPVVLGERKLPNSKGDSPS